MNKNKKISASVMAFVLVLCIGYFSVMSPTSAWFYESGVVDSGDSFIFGDVSVNAEYTNKGNQTFEAATKFADPNEILFDSVIHVDEIEVTNTGTVEARVYADVKNNGTSKGLHWFFYTDDDLEDGSVKKTIESRLTELTEDALNVYNVGYDGNSGYYVLLGPGANVTVKVATWIEYDDVSEELSAGNELSGYDVDIILYAAQNVNGALKR